MADLPGEQETHVLKNPDTIKQALKPLPQNNDVFSPTEPEIRKHAGEVRRRNDRSVRAEPPPPQPAQARTTNQAKRNQGRKKQASGLDGDDGSDSDRDGSRRDFGERDTGVAMLKKTRTLSTPNDDPRAKPKHNVAVPFTQIPLTPEEAARVQFQKQIFLQRKGDEGWQSLLHIRRANRHDTERKKKGIAQWLLNDPEMEQLLFDVPKGRAAEGIWKDTHHLGLQNLRMRHYLDESLWCDMGKTDELGRSNYLPKQISEPELLEEIIKLAETKFVMWWEPFVNPLEPTVQAVVKRLIQPNGFRPSKLRGYLLSYMSNTHNSDRFSAWYDQRILRQLGVSFSEFAMTPDVTVNSAEMLEMLSKSRQTQNSDERLSQGYVDWVCRNAPAGLIDSCCRQRLRQIRGGEIRPMLGMSSATQVFCQDDSGRTISLVLFKDGIPFSVKPVQFHDWKILGWYGKNKRKAPTYRAQPMKSQLIERHITTEAGDNEWSPIFYRYEPDEISGKYFFKVGIDEKLIELWTPRSN
ncbi:hypothetical protein F5Y10DRAFT_228302 [Nemania abortiva]|nr:hypothetical protein F5Y10DRAFT_228302 [Nemania abortiva]